MNGPPFIRPPKPRAPQAIYAPIAPYEGDGCAEEYPDWESNKTEFFGATTYPDHVPMGLPLPPHPDEKPDKEYSL